MLRGLQIKQLFVGVVELGDVRELEAGGVEFVSVNLKIQFLGLDTFIQQLALKDKSLIKVFLLESGAELCPLSLSVRKFFITCSDLRFLSIDNFLFSCLVLGKLVSRLDYLLIDR